MLRRGLRHPGRVEEAQGIYRGEVRSIMVALATIMGEVKAILAYLEGDDGEEEAEDLSDA